MPGLHQEEIFKAIGTDIGVSEEEKRRFIEVLSLELERLFAASKTAYPDKKTVVALNKELDALQNAANKLKEQIEASSFVKSLLGVTSRAIATKGYACLDPDDIEALAEIAKQGAKNERFSKAKAGPDTRLALQVALLIAEKYKRVFGLVPGTSGQGKRGSRKGDVTWAETPYQRICRVIADEKGITIGRDTQKEAIDLMKDNKQPAPFFKVDVQNLPQKKKD